MLTGPWRPELVDRVAQKSDLLWIVAGRSADWDTDAVDQLPEGQVPKVGGDVVVTAQAATP